VNETSFLSYIDFNYKYDFPFSLTLKMHSPKYNVVYNKYITKRQSSLIFQFLKSKRNHLIIIYRYSIFQEVMFYYMQQFSTTFIVIETVLIA